MARHIATCLPNHEELAATARGGPLVYPGAAAELVVDRLAQCDGQCARLFTACPADTEPSIARHFALTVVEAALRTPKNDPSYTQLLTVDLIIELSETVGRVEEGVGRIEAEHGALLQQILQAVRAETPVRDVSDDELIALARQVTQGVADAGQAITELRSVVETYLSIRADAERGTDLGELVDRAIRAVYAANRREDFDSGAQAGEAAFTEWREQQAAARQAWLRLAELNIEQARTRPHPDQAARWIGERLKLDAGDLVDFDALRAEQNR